MEAAKATFAEHGSLTTVDAVDQLCQDFLRRWVVLTDQPAAQKTIVNLTGDELVNNWHALVSSPTSSGYLVEENSYKSSNRFQFSFDKIANLAGAKTVLVSYYLVKYSESTQPSLDEFLDVNVRGADCVYIKVVGSDSPAPLLGVGSSGDDFVTLRMKADANCD